MRPEPAQWALDASTFIKFHLIGRLALLIRARSILFLPEYVFSYELTGPRAKASTRAEAEKCVAKGQIETKSLTLGDLARLAALDMPRRIGLGEAACAILAERMEGGVLCDDTACQGWLRENIRVLWWQCTEEILIGAALTFWLSEYELETCEHELAQNRYRCRFGLREEFLKRRLSIRA